MKRIVLSLVLLLVGLSLGWRFAAGATALPDQVRLSWTGDTATTMTITWRANAGVKTGLVEYQAGTLTGMACRAEAQGSTFSSDAGTSRLFTATLTGLTPGTRYAYRVGDGATWSAARTFTTGPLDARQVKFLVFGDSQSVATGTAPYAAWRATARSAFAAHPDARFMVNVGDLVDTGQSGAHWDAWFAAGAGVIDAIPVMPVMGNHECYPLAANRRTPLYWNALFRLPRNGPAALKQQAYSFNYGPAHLVMLDSQQGEQRASGDILTPQRAWLDADLARSAAPWKIAFFHRGPYTLHPGRNNSDIKTAFCPTLEKRGVALVFNAHDHGIARTAPQRGVVYVTTGRSGIKTYPDLKPHAAHRFFHNPLDQPNYQVVELDNQRLTVDTFTQDGTRLDTFTLEKE